MSYPIVRISTEDPTRQKTPELWRGVLEQFVEPGLLGGVDEKDFVYEADGSAVDADGSGEQRFGNQYTVQNSAAGGTNTNFASVADPTDSVGTADLTADTGTDWFGVSAGKNNAWIKTPSHSVEDRALLVFEARVDLSEADHYFIGLCESLTEFLGATGALPTDEDYIGFFRNDAGELEFVVGNDNNGGTAVTYAVDLLEAVDIPDAADTFAKIGFRVNSDNSVEIYVDEVRYLKTSDGVDIDVPSTAIPIETLREYHETQRGATGDLASVGLTYDWIAVHNV